MTPRTVYFDLETGGVEAHHPDIQLAAIAVDDVTGEELDTFEEKIIFDVSKADPKALEINHYRAEAWKAAQPSHFVVSTFSAFLRRHASLELMSNAGNLYRVAKLAGHNAASFDGPRLRTLFRLHKVFLPADLRVRDTMQLALWYFDQRGGKPPENFKLATLCRSFGVPIEETHEALADVRLTIALAQRLSSMNTEVR